MSVPVLMYAESVQGLQHRRTANVRKPDDLAGGQLPAGVELLKVALAPQAEQGRERNGVLYKRGIRSASVHLLFCRGSRNQLEQRH
jgi:hypothetical protein